MAWTVFTLLLLWLTAVCLPLKLVEIRVPAHVPLGSSARLSCRWALGPADVLYSVKWYKDGREFFRHVPRDQVPRRKFTLPGVDVEDADSLGSNISLAAVVLESAGRYRCEVSGEKPLFPTVSQYADMTVIALPNKVPTLSGIRPQYQIGDYVQAVCSSGKARPAAQITWYINGEPVPAIDVRPAKYQMYPDGLETVTSKMVFRVTTNHFRSGELKIKCLARIPPVYWRSSEKRAILEGLVQHGLDVRRYDSVLQSRVKHGLSATVSHSSIRNPSVVNILICFLCLSLQR